MDIGRIIVAILLPPLAVIDKGCGVVVVVTILWLFGWIPGVIAALIFGNMAPDRW
ncbi:MAG: YqaE/Pmp3 family membrane protein [Chloroflexi bacterium]|nr:MAG: YqaE/Pmp3 family membrane protein [Chloroflexota bacterium]